MRLRHLRTLVAVADGGSFQAAAEHLSLTQSAISMQMKALEERLGITLFDRSMRPPLLTGAGRTLVERSREIVVACDELTVGVAHTGKLFGLLNIGVVPGASLSLLPDALARLRTDYPSVQVRVQSGLSSGLMQRVAQGALDAAIVTEPARLEHDLDCHTVSDESLLVIGPPGDASSDDVSLLAAHPYIAFNRQAEFGRLIDASLRDRGLEAHRTMELDSLDAIVMMVARGLGVAIVGERNVFPRYRGLVHAVPFGEPPLRRRIGVVRRARHRHPELVNALTVELLAVAAAWSDTAAPSTGPPA